MGKLTSVRLNPSCPVCGEDEPKMDWYWETRVSDNTGQEPTIVPHKGLFCMCRRCSWKWSVEPLSKPWEGRGRVCRW